jgi:hypothetical protein
MNASYLTVRKLPVELAAALECEKLRRGTSLNQTVIDLLRLSLGLSETRSNGIRQFAGTWTSEEQEEFLDGIKGFEQIEPDFWK